MTIQTTSRAASATALAAASTPLMHNYARLPLAFARGEGAYLFDQAEKRYFDMLSGIAVCGLGHSHPELVQTLAEQAAKLWHVSNLFEIPEQVAAAEKIVAASGMEKVFFCNSGAEANEAALKLSRLHARQKGIERPAVISFYGGFHGRTFGAMAATANPKIRRYFEPQLTDFIHLPFNDIAALEAQRYQPNVVAVILECLQGEGGIHPVDAAYLQFVRRLCDERGWLLICDEVQVGLCRSGKWFGYQHYDIMPDIITLAKGLGNGLPVGACVARGAAATYFQAGLHGSTFGGTPLVMAVVNKTLEIYQRDNLAAQAAQLGEYLQNQLRTQLADIALVKEIRGQGLMIGIELHQAVEKLVEKGLSAGVIFNVTAEKVIRLLPPLIITRAQIDEFVQILRDILHSC